MIFFPFSFCFTYLLFVFWNFQIYVNLGSEQFSVPHSFGEVSKVLRRKWISMKSEERIVKIWNFYEHLSLYCSILKNNLNQQKQKTRAWRWKSLLNSRFPSKKELKNQKAIRESTDNFAFCLRLTIWKEKKGIVVDPCPKSFLTCSGRIRIRNIEANR